VPEANGRRYSGHAANSKAGERGFFKLINDAGARMWVLIRTLAGLWTIFGGSALRKIGDFSLNVANPLGAEVLMREDWNVLPFSYDLNAQQVLDLLRAASPDWFELTVHHTCRCFIWSIACLLRFFPAAPTHPTVGVPVIVITEIARSRRRGAPGEADVGCRKHRLPRRKRRAGLIT